MVKQIALSVDLFDDKRVTGAAMVRLPAGACKLFVIHSEGIHRRGAKNAEHRRESNE